MKFYHLGDLHFGKTLMDCSLQEDQSFWIDRLLEAADRDHPDAVVVAGDVYDRAAPSTEAMELFRKFICGLAERNIWVLMIPGNHDNAVRLSNISELLHDKRIYIAGAPEKELTHVTIPDASGAETTFWLMPYVFPKLVGAPQLLNREDLNGYDAAIRALLSEQAIDTDRCNVLIAHQNVLAGNEKPLHSESETYIGSLGEVDYTAFDAFDYVALGHIHNAQPIGRDTVRYSGCPLYYDFSETDREKKLTVVTVEGKGKIRIEMQELPLLHRLLKAAGELPQLLELGRELADRDQYYIQATVQGTHFPANTEAQLRAVFGSGLLSIVPEKYQRNAPAAAAGGQAFTPEASIDVQFGRFYQMLRHELLDETREALLNTALEQQEHCGRYYTEYSKIPASDTDALLDHILSVTEEAK